MIGTYMRTINISKAKAHLSRLIEEAANGKPFVIAKGGRPLVRVTAIDSPAGLQARRMGFLKGKMKVPHDFDRMGQAEIESLFGPRPLSRVESTDFK